MGFNGGSETYLVHLRRTRLESLKSLCSRLVGLVIEHEFRGLLPLLFDLALSPNEIDRKSLGILDRDNVTTARSVLQFLDALSQWLGSWDAENLLQFLLRLDFECAAEECFRALFGIVDVLIRTIASVPSLTLAFLDYIQTKI